MVLTVVLRWSSSSDLVQGYTAQQVEGDVSGGGGGGGGDGDGVLVLLLLLLLLPDSARTIRTIRYSSVGQPKVGSSIKTHTCTHSLQLCDLSPRARASSHR